MRTETAPPVFPLAKRGEQCTPASSECGKAKSPGICKDSGIKKCGLLLLGSAESLKSKGFALLGGYPPEGNITLTHGNDAYTARSKTCRKHEESFLWPS